MGSAVVLKHSGGLIQLSRSQLAVESPTQQTHVNFWLPLCLKSCAFIQLLVEQACLEVLEWHFYELKIWIVQNLSMDFVKSLWVQLCCTADMNGSLSAKGQLQFRPDVCMCLHLSVSCWHTLDLSCRMDPCGSHLSGLHGFRRKLPPQPQHRHAAQVSEHFHFFKISLNLEMKCCGF